ncbi:MAG: hypothetical protein F4060_02575 [Holophagales bacterium]|nr:hypothetical protein [Holophagales bacterium]MYG30114.1 hypothetical protein [Holophagales bacterium]MYI78802.1 hypothetical protein [Holophagales bacterium]
MTDSLLEKPRTAHELSTAMKKPGIRDLEERIAVLDRFCEEHPNDHLRRRKARQIQATHRARLEAMCQEQ